VKSAQPGFPDADPDDRVVARLLVIQLNAVIVLLLCVLFAVLCGGGA
jgi:hypothetical protein